MITGTLPCITLHLPWAFWVLQGWKTIETRTHRRLGCLLGSNVGIHASLTWDNYALEAAEDYLTDAQLEVTRKMMADADDYYGRILCTVKAYGFRELDAADAPCAMIETTKVRRFGLFLTHPKRLRPFIKTRGYQGIWHYEMAA